VSVDLTTVTAALTDLYARRPRLPRPHGLEHTVLAAWNSGIGLVPGAPDGPAAAVVRATWPLGARAGANCGHEVAAAAIRQMVGQWLNDEDEIDPGGRWVLWACARAANGLPTTPDSGEVQGRLDDFHQWAGAVDNLDAALTLGLDNGWIAGHRDATDRLIAHFADQVASIVGPHALTTTFLTAHINGDDVVFAIAAAAYHASERDQQEASVPTQASPNRPPIAGRAFTPISQLNGHRQKPPNMGHPPASGAGPTRTGR
jgi:hypothetical protein